MARVYKDGWSFDLTDELPKCNYTDTIVYLALKIGYQDFYDWQIHFLNSFLNAVFDTKPDCVHRFSLLGVHGTGKSTIVAVAVAMLMLITAEKNEPLTGTVIAITERQAESAFWRKLKQLQDKNRDIFNISSNMLWLKNNPFVAINKRAFAKQHTHSLAGEHALNVINIVDEASGAEPEAIDILKSHFTSEWGKLKGFFCLMGNPPKVPNSSEFYKVHKGEITGYNVYDIARKSVVKDLDRDSYTQNIIREVRDTYGRDYDYTQHELYKRLVLGHLPSEGSGQVFPEYILERTRMNQGMTLPPYYIAVDFAGADDPRDNKNYDKNDDSAILVFTSNAFVEGFTVKMRLPEFEQLIIRYINQYQPTAVFCDGLGVGMGSVQRLQNQQFYGFTTTVYSVKGSEKAFNYHRFKNRRSENYWLLREWMEGRYDQFGQHAGGGIARLGVDKINHLFNELRQIKFMIRGGLIALEPKDTLRDSPDFADACAIAMTYQFVSRPKEELVLQPWMSKSNAI